MIIPHNRYVVARMFDKIISPRRYVIAKWMDEFIHRPEIISSLQPFIMRPYVADFQYAGVETHKVDPTKELMQNYPRRGDNSSKTLSIR